jgi:hypothetical protein
LDETLPAMWVSDLAIGPPVHLEWLANDEFEKDELVKDLVWES